MNRANQKLAAISNEKLLNFLKNSIKEVFDGFDTKLSESLEKWPAYSFINFMKAVEENNPDLAIQIYDAILFTFSFESFRDWKMQHYQKICSSTLIEKVKRLEESFIEESEIYEGLYCEAMPLFKACIEKWPKEGNRSSACQGLQNAFFAPKTDESVACCLERLWYVKRKGLYRNYSCFFKIWEYSLKSHILVKTKFTLLDESSFLFGKKVIQRAFSTSKTP